MWNRRQDFSSYRHLSCQEQEQDKVLRVNGKTIKPIGIGTVLLKIEDVLSHIHTLEIQDAMHMPHIPLNIFVPQAFIQQRQYEGDSVASCSINATGITLKWMSESGKEASKYVPLNRSNIGIAFTASGYKNFRAFAAMFAMPATYVSDEEDDDHVPRQSQDEQSIQITSTSSNEDPKHPSSKGATRSPSKEVSTDFHTDPHLIPQEPDAPLLASNQALLMAYHEQLGHTYFAQLQELAKQGTIPKKLANVPLPKCPSCLYGKAHKRPWRTHKIDPKIKPTTVPGAVVSVDQLESPVPGFVPIARGQPTTSRYHGASVFADHVRGFTYVHLHQALTMQETLDATHAFEHVAHQHAVRIMHIIATTVVLRIVRSWMMSARHGKPLPSVVSVPTTRMGWPRGVFVTSLKVPEPCSCMSPTDGPRPSPPTFGHKLSNMPQTYKMPYQEKRKHGLLSHCFPIQQ